MTSEPPVRVRPVEAADRGTWIAMRAELYAGEDVAELALEVDTYLGDGAARELAAVFVAAGPGRRPVGFVEIGLRSYAEGCDGASVAYVEGWFVAEAARRRGVGRALIHAAERWALDRGHRELASDALLHNSVSQHAHTALGFDEVERSVHFRKVLSAD